MKAKVLIKIVVLSWLSAVLLVVFAESSDRCETDKGSFINLCGYCVGDRRGLGSSEGLDECHVCFGSNDCIKCDSFGEEGCEPQSYPHLVDLALDEANFKIYFQKASIAENTENVVCSLKLVDSDGADNLKFPLISENVPYISVDLKAIRKGSYTITCSDAISSSIYINSSLKAVDSRDFKVESLSLQSVKSYVPFKVRVSATFHGGNDSHLICFTRVDGMTEDLNEGKVNSGGEIECGSMIVQNTTAVSIGVAATLEAALESSAKINMKEISVNPSEPLVKKAKFSSDLRNIFIQFDSNLNPSVDCKIFFFPETVSLFGKGWDCWIRADQLIVQLGTEPLIHPGSRISLKPSNEIQQISDSEVSTTIVEDVTDQVVEPVYNVKAHQIACHGEHGPGLRSSLYARKIPTTSPESSGVTVVEVQPLGGQNLIYNWSVTSSPRHNLSQRDMLLIWLSVRMLDKSVRSITTNKVSLNNSLMLSNVEYTVIVKGTNSLGMSGEEKRIPIQLELKNPVSELRSAAFEEHVNACTSGSSLDVSLSNTPATFPDVEFRVDVKTLCCDGTLNSDVMGKIGYSWSVTSSNGSAVKTMRHTGKILIIPPGTFRGGEKYRVSCSLHHKTLRKSLGYANTSVLILQRGIKAKVNVSAIRISTKQPLILDASASVDLDNRLEALKFEWSCREGNQDLQGSSYRDNQCYIPGPKKTLLHDEYADLLRKPILNLPPASLPIGRYQFSVKVSKMSQTLQNDDNVVTVEVSICGGIPPLVFIPTKTSQSGENFYVVNPDDGIRVTGIVTGLKAGCHVLWKSLNQPGFMTLNKSLLHSKSFMAINDHDLPKEFSAELAPGLIGDVKYRIRLSAICSRPKGLLVESSYADVDIVTDAPPVIKPLEVEPHEGEGLVTEFRFSTKPAYDDLLDYPLRYSFGFQILEEGSNTTGPPKFFHSASEKLSATTFLPAISQATTKIQSILRVCDVRQICKIENGPLISTNAPKQLTSNHVESLSEGFSELLVEENYDDAIMLVESSMRTLEVLDDKALYQLASKLIEKAVNSQLDVFDQRLNSSPGEVNAALRFLKAANAALKHGAFSQETLQRLVAFKDKILGMLGDDSSTSIGRSKARKKREMVTEGEQQNILDPEMVRTLLTVSEVAIFNLSDTKRALNEKKKLLQNMSFFMDSLCRGLRNSVPLFVGSRAVSFSVQRLNIQVKYADDLAIPDWRSSKSGDTPVNATAQIRLGEDVQQSLRGNVKCMGAAFYPMDFLSEVSNISIPGLSRHSSVYQVKMMQNSSQKIMETENYEGLSVKRQTVRVKIPIWSGQLGSEWRLECRVWLQKTWNNSACKYVKMATLINKPAVECLCSVVGYYAIFAAQTTSAVMTTQKKAPTLPTITMSPITEKMTDPGEIVNSTIPTMASVPINVVGINDLRNSTMSSLAGTPIPNTAKNFTFKIQEDYSSTVGSNEEAFISQLKTDILKQVEMPANMIASIDVAPGSIIVTLHLVDTDIRTVDDVLPSLAAVLQDGRLSVNSVDGRQLSVPAQSLKLLQHHTENSFVPWIVIGCTGFGLFSIGSLLLAAIIVKRKLKDIDFTNSSESLDSMNKKPLYGKVYLEQTLDGTEATLSRYRSAVNDPLVVSTIEGLVSVMGTNVIITRNQPETASHFMLRPPENENRNSSSPYHATRNINNATNSTANSSGNSGNESINSIHKRCKNPSTEMQGILSGTNCVNVDQEMEEKDSGIVSNGRVLGGLLNNSRSQTPEQSFQQPPDVRILPGTPAGRSVEESSVGIA